MPYDRVAGGIESVPGGVFVGQLPLSLFFLSQLK